MAIQGIESVVRQLQATALQAESQGSRGSAQADFSAQLSAALNRISATQTAARTQAQDFQAGKADVSLNDVMVDLQKSSVSLQMGIQVRNKLIGAYSEIMNMQI